MNQQAPAAWSLWGVRDMVFGSYANAFILLLPIAILSFALELNDVLTFTMSTLTLLAVAERLSHVTNELSKATKSVVLSGLIIVSLGNFVDLVICIFLIKNGMIEYAQLTLIGAILSQLLFLLGLSFIVGGYRKLQIDNQNLGENVPADSLKGTLTFNSTAASSSVGILLFAVIALMAPTLYSTAHPGQEAIMSLSRASAVVMIISYIFLLIFQLGTHKHHYVATGARTLTDDVSPRGVRRPSDVESRRPIFIAVPQDEEQPVAAAGETDRTEPITVSAGPAFVYALVLAGIACMLAEFISDSLNGITNNSQQPGIFLAVIILPIAGNGAEIVTAVIAAWRDQIMVSVTVSVGSSSQIALLVTPLLVLGSWIAGTNFSLAFHVYDFLTVFFAVVIVSVLIQSGRADYFKGVLLLATYLVFAFSYYYHNVVDV